MAQKTNKAEQKPSKSTKGISIQRHVKRQGGKQKTQEIGPAKLARVCKRLWQDYHTIFGKRSQAETNNPPTKKAEVQQKTIYKKLMRSLKH